jgi:hypothetical protein
MSFLMSAANVQINGLQLYRASGESSASHILRFYEGSGILLTSVNATLSAGWNEATFGAPITLTAGARYYLCYNAVNAAADLGGGVSRSVGGFAVIDKGRLGTGTGFPGTGTTSDDFFIGPLLESIPAPDPVTIHDPYTGPTSAQFAAAQTAQAAQAQDSQDRLDLAWWGVWAATGVLLALLVVPRVFARFQFGSAF